MKKILTLCIVHQHRKILLGMKKRGFGAGRWNGFGGKVMPGETIEAAAKREVREEAGIEIEKIEEMGVLDFEFQGDPQELEVHIYKAGAFKGEPAESEEMKPQWFDLEAIPYDTMWPDDKFWLPLFLEGKKFKGDFHFGASDKILSQHLEEVSVIS